MHKNVRIIILPLLLTAHSAFSSQPAAGPGSDSPIIIALGLTFAACGLTITHYFDNYCKYGQFTPTERQIKKYRKEINRRHIEIGRQALNILSYSSTAEAGDLSLCFKSLGTQNDPVIRATLNNTDHRIKE